MCREKNETPRCIHGANLVIGCYNGLQYVSISRFDMLTSCAVRSESRPGLLIKHSYTCGVSMGALDEIVAHLIATRSSHETPQARIFRGA